MFGDIGDTLVSDPRLRLAVKRTAKETCQTLPSTQVGSLSADCYNATRSLTPLTWIALVSTEPDSIPLKDPFTAAVLAWLVPGLGHIYQGRFAKGLLFFVCLMGAFVYGMYLGEWKSVYWAWDDRKPVIEGICRLGMGLPALPSILQSFRKDGEGLPVIGGFQATPSKAELDELNARLSRTWDIAKIYTMIAGLLNILVILDAQSGPAEHIPARARDPKQEPAAA